MKLIRLKHATIGLALTAASIAQAQFTPVPLTPESLTWDVIAERNGPTPIIPGSRTTASVDGGIANTGNTWFEVGYALDNPAAGIPAPGTSFTTNNHTYTLAPSYTANNGIMLDSGYFTNANFQLTTPAAYARLSFLTSGGNGGCQFRWTVQRQDGSTASGTAASPDWFFVNQNIGWVADGRVNAQDFNLSDMGSGNPRLYMVDVDVPASASPITSIGFEYVSGNASGHSVIMAIAGAATAGGAFTPVTGTGYNADVVVEANAPRRWNLEPVTPPTTATMDGGVNNTGNSWFEQGYYSPSNSFGLPAAGSTVTAQAAADHQFTMPASYAGNNAAFLDPTSPTATLTLATPRAAAALSFLTAAGNGPGEMQAVINHQDGSTETKTVISPDWFGGTEIVYTANGRVNVESGLFDSLNSGNPRLYFVDVLLDNATSPITSIDLTYMSTGGRAVIFGLSASATAAIRPSITLQPAGSKIETGASAQLTVTASGTQPLSYQWQRGTGGTFANVTDAGNVSGATTATLNISAASEADSANYRVVVSNNSGSVTSAVATVTVLSSLPDVTNPGDSVSSFSGSFPDNEAPANAINNNTTKYLNRGNGANPLNIPVGLIVTPSSGRSIVSALRFYTANDAPERDPANYVLEGSNNGGATWTLISSNALALPDARNAADLPLDPVAQAIQQVSFANTTVYSMYRLSFSRVKGGTDLMQIGEIEFLGTLDQSGHPNVTAQPAPVTIQAGGTATFTVNASGTPAPTYRWQRNVNGTWVDVGGANTATLTLNNVTTDEAGQYQVIVSNSAGSVTSAPAQLRVLSTTPNILQGGDTAISIGDESGDYWGDATNAFRLFDLAGVKWQNGGQGFSAAAGFPPFVGPVGVEITPAMGTTRVTGIRFYTADANPERDPADFVLEGSVDGNNFVQIASGSLDLPAARNANNAETLIDPLTSAMQEVLFENRGAFATYRLTFNNARNNATANSIQLAEIELLGVASTEVLPVVSITQNANGTLTITSTAPGTLEFTDTLSSTGAGNWQSAGAINGSVTVTPAEGGTSRFYRVRAQ